MIIPDKVKIGGINYRIEVTSHLSLGESYGAEINYKEVTIRLRDMDRQQMERNLWHEIIHGIYSNLGYYEHDEKCVDELAGALYSLIVDNPQLFVPDTHMLRKEQ